MHVINTSHSRLSQGPGHETRGKSFGLRHVHLGPSLGLVNPVRPALLFLYVLIIPRYNSSSTFDLPCSVSGPQLTRDSDGYLNRGPEAAFPYPAVSASFLDGFFGARVATLSVFIPTHEATSTREAGCLLWPVAPRAGPDHLQSAVQCSYGLSYSQQISARR